MDKKKSILILGMFGMIFMFFGGTLSYWIWTTSSEQQTNVVFTVEKDFECAADGGGNITSSDVELIPTDCTNSTYAIKREVTVTPTIYDTELSVYMDLWLDVNSLGTGLSNSTNFSYALTTSDTSCTEGVISTGNFNGKTANDTVKILGKSYSASTTETYWLYIWLDKEETSSSTMNQTFDLSLNGSCANDPEIPPESPVLDEGMIPVVISNDGTVTTISNSDEEWYDYSNKEWANVVLVDPDLKNNYLGTTGKTVSSSDILAYFVWIPRYKYKIPDVISCSDISNPTIENHMECYLPYTMSDTDKESLITWWQEYYAEGTGDSSYTIEQATADIDNMLKTGVLTMVIDGESQSLPIDHLIAAYYSETNYMIEYSATFNGNNNIVAGPKQIDIAFESTSSLKSTGDAINTYYTHPAFTFGSSEVSGIWVGKFETSSQVFGKCPVSILPNKNPEKATYVSDGYYNAKSIKGTNTGITCGLVSNTDSHMMKNSEWGAVAYLSHSKYGINGEIRINNYYSLSSKEYKTGCGASEKNGSTTSTCEIAYGSGVTEYPQSTTGNISGVFDMSGGLNEYVMGNYGNTVGSSGFTIFPDLKYYDLYSSEQFTGNYETNMSLCTLETCGGHALYETAGWYDDYDYFVDSDNPWFIRGGKTDRGNWAGAFSSYYNTGYVYSGGHGYRVSLVVIR